MEDDLLPHSQFPFLFPLYWMETPDDFDIVLVGNQINGSAFDRDPGSRWRRVVQAPGYCLHAYIVSKKGAKRLYELYTGWDPQTVPKSIDWFIVKCMWKRKVKFYCFNGTMFPDPIYRGMLHPARATGICFQNMELGSIIWPEGE